MEIKKGDIFRSTLDGANYTVTKVVNGVVSLESQDGKKKILTWVSTLKIKSFYQKKDGTEG